MRTCKYPLLTLVILLFFTQVQLYAAKGDSKAASGKKGYVLKFNGFELKGFSLNLQSSMLRQGQTYKGSFSNVEKSTEQTMLQSVITYQKGNTTFIYPYRHKVILPRFKTPEPSKL